MMTNQEESPVSATAPEVTQDETESPIARAMRESEDVKHEPEAVVHPDPEPEPKSEAEPEIEEHDSQLDDIELQTAHREWTVEGEIQVQRRGGAVETQTWKRVYVQKPLSFSAMMQFTGLIGERLAQAMSGADGLSLDGVLASVDEGMGPAVANLIGREDFAGVDAFIKGLAKLAMYIPDVIEDCQCIWLRIPFNERPIVKEIWSRSPEDGGLTLEDGEEMLETFLGQNYKEVEDFFVERLPRLLKRVQRLRERAAGHSPRSKRSKLIPAPTQSQ